MHRHQSCHYFVVPHLLSSYFQNSITCSRFFLSFARGTLSTKSTHHSPKIGCVCLVSFSVRDIQTLSSHVETEMKLHMGSTTQSAFRDHAWIKLILHQNVNRIWSQHSGEKSRCLRNTSWRGPRKVEKPTSVKGTGVFIVQIPPRNYDMVNQPEVLNKIRITCATILNR